MSGNYCRRSHPPRLTNGGLRIYQRRIDALRDTISAHLKHVFGNALTDHLLAIHGTDDLSGVDSCSTTQGG